MMRKFKWVCENGLEPLISFWWIKGEHSILAAELNFKNSNSSGMLMTRFFYEEAFASLNDSEKIQKVNSVKCLLLVEFLEEEIPMGKENYATWNKWIWEIFLNHIRAASALKMQKPRTKIDSIVEKRQKSISKRVFLHFLKSTKCPSKNLRSEVSLRSLIWNCYDVLNTRSIFIMKENSVDVVKAYMNGTYLIFEWKVGRG